MNISDTSQTLPPQKVNSNYVALTTIGASFIAIMGVTIPFVSMQLRSPLPYMATPRHKVEKALKFLILRRNMQIGNQKKNSNSSATTKCSDRTQPRFVDLGSGDGTTIFAASSLSFKSTGIELNSTLWALSSLRRMFQPNAIRNNCTFIHGDMFNDVRLQNELKNANCVMIFGVTSLMPKIADLIVKECNPGIFIMSYRFRVPLLTEEEKCDNYANALNESRIPSGVIDASLIYEEEEMRVYEIKK